MTAARLLVVAWMACVFAIGLWHRPSSTWPWPRLRPRPSRSSPAFALTARDRPADVIEIQRTLRFRYDEIEYRENGAVVVAGLAYVGEALVEIHDDELRRRLPDTRFFKTRLQTGIPHSPEVGLLVSYRRTRAGNDIRSSVASLEGGPSRKFLGQFIGLVAPSVESRRALTRAMATLMAASADDGRATMSPNEADEARAEIWAGSTHWRDIDVTTDHDGRVSQIVSVVPGTFILDTFVH
jgi:hypothetical protein